MQKVDCEKTSSVEKKKAYGKLKKDDTAEKKQQGKKLIYSNAGIREQYFQIFRLKSLTRLCRTAELRFRAQVI